MKKILFAIGLILICSFTVMAEEEEPVFMGLYWGDSLDALGGVREATSDFANYLVKDFYGYYKEDMEWVYLSESDFSNLKFKIYTRLNEIKSLGTVPVAEVMYGFIEGRLALIHITTPSNEPSWDNLQYKMLNLVEARYGELSYQESPNEYFDVERRLENKIVGDTYVGSTSLGFPFAWSIGHFHLHSVSLFEEAKVILKQRKIEKEEAYKKRLQSESKLW